MRKYLKGWDFMRVIRLMMGIIIIIQGVNSMQWNVIFLGGLFSLLPILNIGCCSSAGCASSKINKDETNKTLIYEEVN
ncbi:MAG: hypothetical protein IPN93_00315 [Bacteroidetes bacterium]|nr:hypothetical protein [Bacteroidota bacterium]